MAKKKRLGILTVALAVAVVIAGAVMVNGALKDAAKQQAEQEKIDSAQKTEEVVEEEPSELEATLFFASDYQEGEQGAPSDNLRGILNAVKADKPSLDGMIFCGDYSNVSGKSNYEITPEPAISEIKGILGETYPDLTEENMISHWEITIRLPSPSNRLDCMSLISIWSMSTIRRSTSLGSRVRFQAVYIK